MQRSTKHLLQLVVSLIGLFLVVGAVVLVSLNRVAVYNGLVALYLVPQPERLTELYFDNNEQLPGSISASREVSFTFVIHNLETSDFHYTYRVIVSDDSIGHIVDQDSVYLKDGEYFSKEENFKLLSADRNQEVIVELINKQQFIDFWMGGK